MQYLFGQIALMPYNFTPVDWLPCEGQQLPINQNQVLFSLLGAQFGGDGRTTFALPNLKGKEPVPGMRYFIAVNGVYPNRP
jgi:microcystin-dependent protein